MQNTVVNNSYLFNTFSLKRQKTWAGTAYPMFFVQNYFVLFMPTRCPAVLNAASKATVSCSSIAQLPASVTPPLVATLCSSASKLSLFCAA